jgi:surface carbohydrate biosynthesis protein
MRALPSIRKAFNYLRLFLLAEKDWRKPERKPILIFDGRTGQPLLNYIDPAHASLLYDWRERSNLYVFLRCVLSLRLSALQYAKHYVAAVHPTAVITLSDNSATFYELKAFFPDITMVSIQFSWRGEETDIFHHFKTRAPGTRLGVDYVLAYNQEVGRLYQRYVGGKALPIGSLINNHFGRAEKIDLRSLVFISEFRPRTSHVTDDLKTKTGEKATWDHIYSLERMVLPFLADYCRSKGLTFTVCGAKTRDHALEREFYAGLLGDRPWQWVPRTSWYSNYGVIKGAGFVVYINSTLGYESLARGKKVACLSARGNWYQDSTSWKFGWPSKLPDTGPFWTNHADVEEFRRVLDYATSVSDPEWLQTWRQFGPQIMAYDEGNSHLVSLLRGLDVPVKIDNEAVPALKAIRT